MGGAERLPARRKDGSVKRILIIDDEPDFVEMVKMRLEANSYDVVTAFNGEEGIQKAETEHPNLILLDVMMPGSDGFAVLKKLKSIPSTRYIPVVMLTAKRESKSIMTACDRGAVDYIIKPCESQELLKAVRKHAAG